MGSLALDRGFRLHRTPMPGSRSAPTGAQTSFLRRIFAAVERWRHRQVEQEAARFIAAHGGRITDDVERQLGEHLTGGRGFVR